MRRLSDDARAILAECEADARALCDDLNCDLCWGEAFAAEVPPAVVEAMYAEMPTFAEVAEACRLAGVAEVPF